MARNAVFRKVTHCIFDLDGTLLDTEKIYEAVVRQIAQSFNKPYPLDVRMRIMGTTEKRSAEIAIKELNLPIGIDDYLNRYHKLCKELLGQTDLMKGAERLLRHLHAHNIPMSVATSSAAEQVAIKTQNYQELFRLFNHCVCGSTDPEVKNGKPAPDIFLLAAQRFPDRPAPQCCLVFEDAPNGVQGAIAANMQCIMIPDPRVSEESTKLATQVLKTLEDFKPEEFGLPPFPNC